MKLSQVLRGVAGAKIAHDCQITGISYNSQKIQKGQLFVAIKGLQTDGHLYLKQAFDKGACAAVVEQIDNSLNMEQIKVDNSRKALASASSNFYDKPTEDLLLIGVTGTNGKTTTTYMLERIYHAAGQKTGMIGTVSYRIGSKDFPVSRTTPESLELQEFFSQMVKEKVQTAIIEVSSHSVQLHRIDESQFNQLIFTNLTQDHLDFHHNFENYYEAKKRLFEINKQALHIINLDDEFGKRLIDLGRQGGLATFGFSHGADFRASKIKVDAGTCAFNVHYEGHTFRFELLIGGSFNIHNALAAIASAVKAGISPEVIQQGLYDLQTVPGRFEAVQISAPFKVIVDYAHTPDGLENLLKSARQVTEGRLITVFGCGGERDKGKRPLMGQIAFNLSDLAIVTSDNPRTEEPMTIIKEIIGENKSFITEVDRRQAIEIALREARESDTVIIAGKGHENTQEINGERISFSDREVVKEIVSQLSSVNGQRSYD